MVKEGVRMRSVSESCQAIKRALDVGRPWSLFNWDGRKIGKIGTSFLVV